MADKAGNLYGTGKLADQRVIQVVDGKPTLRVRSWLNRLSVEVNSSKRVRFRRDGIPTA